VLRRGPLDYGLAAPHVPRYGNNQQMVNLTIVTSAARSTFPCVCHFA